MYAEIVVDIKHKELNRVFDYRIPEAWTSFCVVGMRVLVSFGHQTITGIVVKIKAHTDLKEVKDIDAIDSTSPVINQKQWDLIFELTHTYRMLLAQALDIVIPSVFHTKVLTVITKLAHHETLDAMHIPFNKDSQYTLKKKDKHLLTTLKILEGFKVVDIKQMLDEKKPLKQLFNYVCVKTDNTLFSHYTDVLDTHKTYVKQELMDLGISASGIKTLIKHDILKQIKFKEHTQTNLKTSVKWRESKKWLGHIDQFKEELLSYIDFAKQTNASMLILTPNRAMQSHVSKMIDTPHHVYHGTLTINQKRRVIDGLDASSLVVGMRSSIFLPFKQLKHIVIVDAHDLNYQLHMGLYYDTLDLIQKHFNSCYITYHTLLETPYVFELHKKNLVIDKRVTPHVSVISMKDELLEGNTQMVSKALERAIEHTLKHKQKVFILHQRKGYHLVNTCRLCGYNSVCETCQTLYHVNANHMMVCPNCSDEKTFEDTCMNNHHHMMKPIGIGIEHVTQTFKKMYPHVNIGMVTTHTKHVDEVIQSHDIVIGTSAIKYHMKAFKDGLVAILLADVLWHHFEPNTTLQALIHVLYMTNYVTPNLKKPTLIQTYDPNHEVMQALSHQETFLNGLYLQQEALLLPPKYVHYEIKIPSKSYLQSYQEGLKLKASLQTMAHVIGPRKIYDEDEHFTLTVKVLKSQLKNVLTFFDTIRFEVKPI